MLFLSITNIGKPKGIQTMYIKCPNCGRRDTEEYQEELIYSETRVLVGWSFPYMKCNYCDNTWVTEGQKRYAEYWTEKRKQWMINK